MIALICFYEPSSTRRGLELLTNRNLAGPVKRTSAAAWHDLNQHQDSVRASGRHLRRPKLQGRVVALALLRGRLLAEKIGPAFARGDSA